MADDKARQTVNQAQFDRVRQQAEAARPVHDPAERIAHSIEYVDLIGVCAQFVATTGKVVASLRGSGYTEEERDVIRRNVSKVRVAADWIDTAVEGAAKPRWTTASPRCCGVNRRCAVRCPAPSAGRRFVSR